MKQQTKQWLWLIAFGVILYAALMNFATVISLVERVLGLIMPVIMGLFFAFVLSVPMGGYERLLRRWSKKEWKGISGVSLALTMITIFLVVVVVVTTAVPVFVSSVMSVVEQLRQRWPEWMSMLQQRWPEWSKQLSDAGINLNQVPEWLETLDYRQILMELTSGAGSLISSAVGVASTTFSWLGTVMFGLIVAVYVLLDKNRLCRQSVMLCDAALPACWAKQVRHVAQLSNQTFRKFLSGQCIEAIVLGSLIMITFRIAGLPYAALIAMLTSVCAFIPYVGAFLSCVIGTFLTLLSSPRQAIVCLILYMIVQFVETQFIYPHVVGGSVGLSPLWTLVAALVGGKLFGLLGMIFFVPLTAVIYALVREATLARLNKKKAQVSVPAAGAEPEPDSKA